MIAAEQIERQARVCEANLERVRDKLADMNGDMAEIANQLKELREQVSGLTMNMVKQVAALTLAMNQQIASMTEAMNKRIAELDAKTQQLNQRWSVWPMLERIIQVVATLVALGLSVYALTH